MQTIYIKNMVCDRCKAAVEKELEKLAMHAKSVELGEVILQQSPTENQSQQFKEAIQRLGFEWIDNKKSAIISRIKTEVIEYTQNPQKEKFNFSTYLSNAFGKDYSTLTSLFSQVQGITIEQYIIPQRVEKLKELLKYDELTVSEIAYQLQYSGVARLSNQFKKVTGLTPADFKKLNVNLRQPLDKV